MAGEEVKREHAYLWRHTVPNAVSEALVQAGPETACRTMASGSAVLARHWLKVLDKAVTNALGRFLAAAPIDPAKWDRVLVDW
jgi:hypothetical protein